MINVDIDIVFLVAKNKREKDKSKLTGLLVYHFFDKHDGEDVCVCFGRYVPHRGIGTLAHDTMKCKMGVVPKAVLALRIKPCILMQNRIMYNEN